MLMPDALSIEIGLPGTWEHALATELRKPPREDSSPRMVHWVAVGQGTGGGP
ncbi:hypothetical protein [Caballeronia sp. LjRoot31]|uniref:hypothetical protein n=1 Tax=Caballeronia sp. LjRoot31 TaxID=3342324 RepID=UPI003ECD3FDE